MQTKTFTIFSKKELAAIQNGLDSILSIWAEKWLVTTGSCPSITTVTNAYETGSQLNDTDNAVQTSIDRQNTNGTCKLNFSAQASQQIYRRATGDNTPRATQGKSAASTVEIRLVTKILDDLLAMILSDPSTSAETIQPYPKDVANHFEQTDLGMYKGSGTMIAAIADHDCAMHLILSQTLAQSLSGRTRPKRERANLTPRKSVIGKGKIKIQVTAGEIELRLSDLVGLIPGHVLRLNLKTDQPFVLETVDTQAKICDAYLGQRDGNKAIQLINQ